MAKRRRPRKPKNLTEARRGGMAPDVLSKPPKKPNEMTDEEIDGWAKRLFQGLSAQRLKNPGKDAP